MSVSAAFAPAAASTVRDHPARSSGTASASPPGTSTASDALLPPVAVALDASLVKPQAGDSPATRKARAALALAQTGYATANQRFDQAAAAAAAAQVRLVAAQGVAAAARAAAERARGDLQAIALNLYENGDPVPVSVQVLLSSSSGGDVLDDLQRQGQLQAFQAKQTGDALDAQSAADAAAAELQVAQAVALQTQEDALAAQRSAAQLVTDAQRAVAALHIKDLEAAARAAAERARVAGSRNASGLDNAAAAADALQAQALASGAATVKSFPSGATVIDVIAIATRALLAKAAKSGTSVADETAVMGAAPNLGGSVPFTGQTGTGPSVALNVFDGKVSHANWPNAGVGTKVRGTAPFLAPDGVNVHPTLPRYPKGYRPLRAQIAVDNALAQLGSPYVWDAAGPRTFDCSGLTLWAWGHAGIALEHFTGQQVQEGVAVAPDQLLPGDLLLFGKDLHHVGMYLGAGYMIDAPNTGDYVKIQLVSDMGDFTVAVRP